MKRTVSAAVLGAVVLGFAALVGSTPAYAAGCSASQITVVVQFPSRTEIGCAAGNVASGYAALESAGFAITYAVGNGSGAICSIKGYPSKQCVSMPPADAYWAYFRGEPGGDWTYSTRGGGSSNPDPGTVEGWRFGDGAKPDLEPPAPTAPSPTSAPTAKPTKKPTGHGATTPVAPDATASVSATATGTPTATATASDLPASGAPVTPTNGATNAVIASSDDEPADTDDSDGVSWVWGLVLLGVFAAIGGGILFTRRRA